jgi:hypothetical protein
VGSVPVQEMRVTGAVQVPIAATAATAAKVKDMDSIFVKRAAIVSLLVLILGGTVGYYFYKRPTTTTSSAIRQDPLTVLLANSDSFATAERLRNAGDAASAIPLYQKALAETTDIDQQGQIRYLIATSQDRTSTIGTAIQELKDIAANPAYSALQRAYAVQKIGELFYRNTNQNLTSVVFSGAPYADFFKEKNKLLALRRLSEHANSFYPLAISELRAANWYAVDLIRLSKKKPLTASDQVTWDADVAFVQSALTKADADISRTLHFTNASKLIPDALTHKAQVLGNLKVAGVDAADPEVAFQTAIDAGIANGNDLTPRYDYAIYLAREYGTSRATDIQKHLSVIYSNLEKNNGFKIFFENEKRNATGGKATMVKLASIDPEFKKALLSLGWKNTDFK